MKHFLLLLLFIPLQASAQFGRSYTGPTMQQNQQSRMDFNRRVNQRTQDFQMQQLQKQRYRSSSSPRPSAEALLKAQAKQQQLEQAANEKLAQLAQEQQRKRQQQPASNAQQAAIQQKKDEKQLTQLAVKNYREVFLPGLVSNAMDARQLSPKAEQELANLTTNLMDKTWWKKQQGPQLAGSVKAYGDTLAALTTGFLGFDLASPPSKPAPVSVSSLDAQLANDVFDQNAANQVVREAALTEKLMAGERLVKAVNEFSRLSAAASSPELQNNPKKLKEDVQASLTLVNKALSAYYLRIGGLHKIDDAKSALMQATAAYLPKKGK